MYIGKLAGTKTSYCRRGTDNALLPDLAKNEGFLTWKWSLLLDVGVDIKVTLQEKSFVDRILLKQKEKSAIKSAAVYIVNEDGVQRCVGRTDAQTDGVITDENICVEVAQEATALIIRLQSTFQDVIIEAPQIIGAIFEDCQVYPTPVKMDTESGVTRSLCSITSIVAEDALALSAAQLLSEKLLERYGMTIPVLQDSNRKDSILFRLEDRPEEGYTIESRQESMILGASDTRGFIYAAETFLQLIHMERIFLCSIEDHPRMNLRGVHIGLPPREEIAFFKRMIKYLWVPMRYNTLFLQITAGMRFDRHPEINDAWVEANEKANAGIWPTMPHGDMIAGGKVLEKAEVADLVAYAKQYGMEVIPEIQSLAHVQYITNAYPELAEIDQDSEKNVPLDQRNADQPPDTFYKHCYCPSNEKSYEILFDIIDEIVEVVKPARYVHMGHDEVYQIGICPLCKGKDPAELLAYHINKVYDYLAGKNLKMMIWGDMFHANIKPWTAGALDKIAKDIILLDFVWYFYPEEDLEDELLSHGFKVCMGNMYSSHYTRYEKRVQKQGMIGAQISTWCRPDETVLAQNGKLYDMMFSSQMMWSNEYNSSYRHIYEKMIVGMQPRIRAQLRGSLRIENNIEYMPIPLPISNTKLPIDLMEALEKYNFSGIQELSSSGSCIPVDQVCDKLLFYHTASHNDGVIPWERSAKIGGYLISYEDGTTLDIPVEYGGNIAYWNRNYAAPMKTSYYRHTGYIGTYLADPVIQTKTFDGKVVTVYGYEWENPNKGKRISSIHAYSQSKADSKVILVGIYCRKNTIEED